jgi:hypothetical protein
VLQHLSLFILAPTPQTKNEKTKKQKKKKIIMIVLLSAARRCRISVPEAPIRLKCLWVAFHDRLGSPAIEARERRIGNFPEKRRNEL